MANVCLFKVSKRFFLKFFLERFLHLWLWRHAGAAALWFIMLTIELVDIIDAHRHAEIRQKHYLRQCPL